MGREVRVNTGVNNPFSQFGDKRGDRTKVLKSSLFSSKALRISTTWASLSPSKLEVES